MNDERSTDTLKCLTMSWLRWTCWQPVWGCLAPSTFAGVSRKDARTARVTVAASDWCGFAETYRDLRDASVMDRA